VATVYAVDGSTRTVEPKNGKDFKLRELQEIVEGYIQVIYLTPGADKEVADSFPGTRDFIVGPALVCDSEQVL